MKIAFLFSGQGAQYPGMMKDLYETFQEVHTIFDKADECLSRNISQMCFYGTQEELNLTHNTQPCVLAADIAVGNTLQAHGIVPDAVAGFSLGEYAAMYFARVFKLEDVFPLVQIRADEMQRAVPIGEGAMAALIGVAPEKVQMLCSRVNDEYVVPANYNSLEQTVVSGTASGVDKLLELAIKEGGRAVKLPVSAPFHCSLMEPAAIKLKEQLGKIDFSDPVIPLYLNYTGEKLDSGSRAKEMLVNQVFHAVQWVKTLQNMQADGIDIFIECGPGKTLSNFVKKTLKDVTVLRVENEKTLNETLHKLGIS